MTENEFRKILCEAMNEEYRWVPQPEELEYEYSFSPEFEKKMQSLLRENISRTSNDTVEYKRTAKGFDERSCIRIGHRSLRKMTVIIVAAVMTLALAACTAIYVSITWNEMQNEEHGTLDVTFEIDNNIGKTQNFEAKRPKTPRGFEIAEEDEITDMKHLSISYRNDDELIYYSQDGMSENMSLSIDNDDEGFTEIRINGYKGYAITKGSSPYIIWSDGEYLYSLNGNVMYEILNKMAQSLP